MQKIWGEFAPAPRLSLRGWMGGAPEALWGGPLCPGHGAGPREPVPYGAPERGPLTGVAARGVLT